jgi:hypothetical protein
MQSNGPFHQVDLNAGKGVDAKAIGKSKKKVSTYYYKHAYFLLMCKI